jgi:hypothetical protein
MQLNERFYPFQAMSNFIFSHNLISDRFQSLVNLFQVG